MIAIEEADRLLESCRRVSPCESIPLHDAAGRILGEPIQADRAYPASDVVRMDGVAIPYPTWEKGAREFPVMGMAKAGEARRTLADPAACLEVMTGAVCPEGCDTIIPYEEIRLLEGAAILQSSKPILRSQHIHPVGFHCSQHQVLVPKGVRLNAPRIAVAASVGKSRIRVARRPRIAIVATGDELVEVATDPLPHQIRLSNPYGLKAMLGGLSEPWVEKEGDDPGRLSALFGQCLDKADMLLVTGGVSAGKLDFVPEVLARLGVETLFHRIAQRPGKPLWLGRSSSGQPVFGLPGNPVSALVCARRFVAPLLQFNLGMDPIPSAPRVRLASDIHLWEAGTQFVPVSICMDGEDGVWSAVPKPTQGSGDFTSLGDSDGFVEIPPGKGFLRAGESARFFSWEI